MADRIGIRIVHGRLRAVVGPAADATADTAAAEAEPAVDADPAPPARRPVLRASTRRGLRTSLASRATELGVAPRELRAAAAPDPVEDP